MRYNEVVEGDLEKSKVGLGTERDKVGQGVYHYRGNP